MKTTPTRPTKAGRMEKEMPDKTILTIVRIIVLPKKPLTAVTPEGIMTADGA